MDIDNKQETTVTALNDYDTKLEFAHDEVHATHLSHDHLEAKRAELWSEYQNLTVWQTMKTFKWAAVICLAVTFSAATDGYQVSIGGRLPSITMVQGPFS
jgi:hypothetical protein